MSTMEEALTQTFGRMLADASASSDMDAVLGVGEQFLMRTAEGLARSAIPIAMQVAKDQGFQSRDRVKAFLRHGDVCYVVDAVVEPRARKSDPKVMIGLEFSRLSTATTPSAIPMICAHVQGTIDRDVGYPRTFWTAITVDLSLQSIDDVLEVADVLRGTDIVSRTAPHDPDRPMIEKAFVEIPGDATRTAFRRLMEAAAGIVLKDIGATLDAIDSSFEVGPRETPGTRFTMSIDGSVRTLTIVDFYAHDDQETWIYRSERLPDGTASYSIGYAGASISTRTDTREVTGLDGFGAAVPGFDMAEILKLQADFHARVDKADAARRPDAPRP